MLFAATMADKGELEVTGSPSQVGHDVPGARRALRLVYADSRGHWANLPIIDVEV
jgi:hypothetical protein